MVHLHAGLSRVPNFGATRLTRINLISQLSYVKNIVGYSLAVKVAQSVNDMIINRDISRSIPSCVTGHGVSIVNAQLRIPLDLCSPTVHSAKCSRNRV